MRESTSSGKLPVKRTTLVLPISLHVQLKKAAIDEGRDMQDLVTDAVAAYLEQKHGAPGS